MNGEGEESKAASQTSTTATDATAKTTGIIHNVYIEAIPIAQCVCD